MSDLLALAPVTLTLEPSARQERYYTAVVPFGDADSILYVTAHHDRRAKRFDAHASVGTCRDGVVSMSFAFGAPSNRFPISVLPANRFNRATFGRWLDEIADPTGQACTVVLPCIIADALDRAAVGARADGI
jgi:hypothetical protein